MSLISLKREDNNFISYYDSSNVLTSKYNLDEKKLNVIFKRGGSYVYENIELTDFIAFTASESQGKYHSKYMRELPFEKGKSVNTVQIVQFIDELKKSYDSNTTVLT